MGERHIGRVLHEQMGMVFRCVDLSRCRPEAGAQLGREVFAPGEYLCGEHAAVVFGVENPVDVEPVDGATSVSGVGVWVLG